MEGVSKAIGCYREVGLGKEPEVIESDCMCGLGTLVCCTDSDSPLTSLLPKEVLFYNN